MRSSDTRDTLHIVTAPLGTLADYDVRAREVERVVATSDDLAKRILRLRTSRGEIGLRYGAGLHAADGDVIYADESVVVALDVARDDVLVCRPHSIAHALRIAHALGNRHLPVQIDGEAIVVRYERLVEELFAAEGAAYARESRKLQVPFRHAHAPHGHA